MLNRQTSEPVALPKWVAEAIFPHRTREPIVASAKGHRLFLGLLLVVAALNLFGLGFSLNTLLLLSAMVAPEAAVVYHQWLAIRWLDRRGAWEWLPDLPPTRQELWWRRRMKVSPWVVFAVIWVSIVASVAFGLWLGAR